MSINKVQLAVFTYLNFDNTGNWPPMLAQDLEGVARNFRGAEYSPKFGALFVVTIDHDLHSRGLPETELRDHESIMQSAERLFVDTFGPRTNPPGRIRSLPVFDRPERAQLQREIAFPHYTFVEFDELREALGGPKRLALELVSSETVTQWWSQMIEPAEFWDGVSRFGGRAEGNVKGYSFVKKLTDEMPTGRILRDDHDDMVFYAWRALRHGFDTGRDPFQFLRALPIGEQFRISDLHELYEAVRGASIQRDYFRRMVTAKDAFIRETGIQSNSDSLMLNNKGLQSRPGKPAGFYAPRYYHANK